MRSDADFVVSVTFSQGQFFSRFELCGKRSNRNVRCRFRGRRSTFARSSTDFVAGAAFSQGQMPISLQAQHFHKVKYRFRGRHNTFASLGTDR